ncbi:astacin-like metalloendopeptidase [Ambystoma mexicanum]|uniref:astacin-like metalloendopeptidase n=1 Tax=Ambystoma mexicanum TaxID=8296 RepID=UPI0037E88C71
MARAAAFLAFACLLGCTVGLPLLVPLDSPSQGDITETDSRETESTEIDSTRVDTIFSKIRKINEGSNIPLTEGDIRVEMNRNVLNCPMSQCFWPISIDGRVRVPFVFSDVYDDGDIKVVLAGMQEFTTLTCVDFVPRSTETDYLKMVSGSGCWSYIGRIGGVQPVTLTPGSCMVQGIIEHELMHNLGFNHESNRKDRDNYVDVMWQYLSKGDQGNFDKRIDGNTLGLPYDYSSVMHFDSFAYSNTSGKKTVIPKPDPTIPIGQRYGLSNLDVAKVNKLYNCNLCRSLLSDPSGSFASTEKTSQFQNEGSCLWLIRIPKDKIFLWFNDFNLLSSDGCRSSYLRVYDGKQTTSPVLLDSTCGLRSVPSLISSGNSMLVEFVYNGPLGSQQFSAAYNAVQCGGSYTNVTGGTIASPNFPKKYPPSTDCIWTIVAPMGYTVSLSFIAFSLERQPSCGGDYLSIYDDGKPASPLVSTYCLNSPGTITSVGNTLRLQFHSDAYLQFGGFLAAYTFIS